MARKRSTDDRIPALSARAFAKIARALGALERYTAESAAWNMAHLSTACALGYLNFRYGDYDWRADHPDLARWFNCAKQRPALDATSPQDPTTVSANTSIRAISEQCIQA